MTSAGAVEDLGLVVARNAAHEYGSLPLFLLGSSMGGVPSSLWITQTHAMSDPNWFPLFNFKLSARLLPKHSVFLLFIALSSLQAPSRSPSRAGEGVHHQR